MSEVPVYPGRFEQCRAVPNHPVKGRKLYGPVITDY